MGKTNRSSWIALILLTGINLLNYIDRNIFSALMPAMKADLHFTDTQLGLLGSGFIIAYLFISPIFGWLGDRYSRHKIMGLGIMFWSVATAFTGIARNFVTQMASRIAVGMGESAYTVIAPGTLADHFPRTSRGRVFAVFSAALPVGSALGFLLGGLLEARIGWERSFFVVGVPGLCLAVLLWWVREPERGTQEPDLLENNGRQHLIAVGRELFANRGFVTTVLGYAAYTFVLGGVSFWMPSYIVRYFNVSLAKGNIVFGGVTVAGGFVGTLLGGWLADKLERKTGNGYLKVCVLSIILAVPLFVLTLGASNFNAFSQILFVMEVALFLCTSPLDAAVLNFVRPELRSMAMAINVFLIHILGDGISRTLIGHVSDASGLKAAVVFFPWVLGLAGVLWLIAIVVHWQPLEWPMDFAPLPVSNGKLSWPKYSVDVSGLDKSLAIVAQHPGNLHLHVEWNGRGSIKDITKTLKSELMAQNMTDRVLISSSSAKLLRQLSCEMPNTPRALMVSGDSIRTTGLALYARPHAISLHTPTDHIACENFRRRGIVVI